MRTITRASLAAALSLALVGAGASAALALHQNARPAARAAAAPAARTVHPAAGSTAHVLKGTYFTSGNYDNTVPAGFTPLDPVTTFKCTKKCVLETDLNIQVTSSAASDLWTPCPLIDGVNGSSACAYIGFAPTDTYGVGANVETETLAAGTHTVQTEIYANTTGVTAYNWSSVFRVYQP